ncbi:hypothetical protein CC85DRAFT_288027 [Cutaneotrichosporon oleaginosum]|uniref:Uncharacterized protein n=1 Tax=Cutaneotrichosporon oleaginosum TaxID=879819 RepID=A0A0J1AXA9_9TREE|nr:uncharacterized protein CC85DRAFT_288027 [Cutaneotrichosporon oleaginosum]KLT39939.1 hypothetical protein CC85DRAFT_288027 [Cutaneotrichosporon oleaginosum]TXT08353.1 hypothetical protein COLE_05277 [Cutaneotrichosporon oleaginosum]
MPSFRFVFCFLPCHHLSNNSPSAPHHHLLSRHRALIADPCLTLGFARTTSDSPRPKLAPLDQHKPSRLGPRKRHSPDPNARPSLPPSLSPRHIPLTPISTLHHGVPRTSRVPTDGAQDSGRASQGALQPIQQCLFTSRPQGTS